MPRFQHQVKESAVSSEICFSLTVARKIRVKFFKGIICFGFAKYIIPLHITQSRRRRAGRGVGLRVGTRRLRRHGSETRAPQTLFDSADDAFGQKQND